MCESRLLSDHHLKLQVEEEGTDWPKDETVGDKHPVKCESAILVRPTQLTLRGFIFLGQMETE